MQMRKIHILDFQGKKWRVVSKIKTYHVHNSNNLKEEWKCDMVIKDKTHYWILDKIIDVEFEEIK